MRLIKQIISSQAKRVKFKDSFKFKVYFKVEMPTFDGNIDIKKVDDWTERLGTYFTFYDYSLKEKLTLCL